MPTATQGLGTSLCMMLPGNVANKTISGNVRFVWHTTHARYFIWIYNIYMCRKQHFVFDPVHLFLQTRAASQGKVPHHKDFTTQILRDKHLLSMREPDRKWVWSASTVAVNEMATITGNRPPNSHGSPTVSFRSFLGFRQHREDNAVPWSVKRVCVWESLHWTPKEMWRISLLATMNILFQQRPTYILASRYPRKMFVFSPKVKDVKITFPTLANATNNVLQIIPVAFADIPS